MTDRELTFEEFSQQPLTYTLGTCGELSAHRAYRNEDLGIQKEVITKRKQPGDIYGGWEAGQVYFFLDGDPRQFRTSAELYVAWMEKVCGMPRGSGEWKDEL